MQKSEVRKHSPATSKRKRPVLPAAWVAACACLALAAAAALQHPRPARAASAAPPSLEMEVEPLPLLVRVHLRSVQPLPRHFLRATGESGDVSLSVDGRLTRSHTVKIGSGGIRSVSAQHRGGQVVVRVEREAPGDYRSCYTPDRREIVLEVAKVAAEPLRAEDRQAGRPVAATSPSPTDAPPPVLVADAPRERVAARAPDAWRVFTAAGGGEKLVTLDFMDADIQVVLKALAIQSGANILVAPNVAGKVTVGLRNQTPEQALEYIVRLTGLAYGRDEDTYIVCPRAAVAEIFPPGSRGQVLFPPRAPETSGAPGTTTPPAAAPQTQVVRTERVAAANVLQLLQRLMPGLKAETLEQKALVLIGSAAEIQTAQDAIKALEAALPVPGELVVPPVPALEDVQIETYILKHVSAVEAGRILEAFMKAGLLPRVVVTPAPSPTFPVAKGDTAPRAPQTAVDPAAALLNLVFGGRSPLGTAGTGAPEGAGAAMAPGLGATGTASPELAAGSTVAIAQGTVTNTLLLIGQADDITRVRGYLDRIDVAPAQVMIDVKVTDVTLSAAERLGVTWNWSTFGIREIAPVGGTASVVPGMELERFGHVPVSFNATLEALISTDNARLLANPRVAVLDGRTAEIHVGDTVRYLKQRTVGVTGSTVETGEVDVGVLVNVTPRIGGDRVITLDVRPKVNVITGFTSTGEGGEVPNTSERSVETVVRLRDGETLAIGGLIRDEDVDVVQKVWGLGDLPVLGQLFRSRNKKRTSSEVLIFITPTIVPETP
ncbi:MAG: hypothetical protein HY321_15575 [Armatimonadetes bacterium]|nr:hypothetical protein [Armatimonadota bacterium]